MQTSLPSASKAHVNMPPHIVSLHTYPVKGCKGIRAKEIAVFKQGAPSLPVWDTYASVLKSRPVSTSIEHCGRLCDHRNIGTGRRIALRLKLRSSLARQHMPRRSTNRVRAAAAGLAFDRHWMVVDASSGTFLSQRNTKKLALVRAQPFQPFPARMCVSDTSPMRLHSSTECACILSGAGILSAGLEALVSAIEPLQIGTHLPDAELATSSSDALQRSGTQSASCLSLSRSGCPDLSIPLAISLNELAADAVAIDTLSASGQDSRRRRLVRARVWEWSGVALDEGGAAAAWLSDALDKPARHASRSSMMFARVRVPADPPIACGKCCAENHLCCIHSRCHACRLVRYLGMSNGNTESTSAAPAPGESRREVDTEFAVDAETAFSDGYPLTIASEVRALQAPANCNRVAAGL